MQTVEAVGAFLLSRQTRNVSTKTLEYYRWCLTHVEVYESLPTDPSEIERVLAGASTRLAPESLRDLYRGLRIFYRWVCRRFDVPNPIVKGDGQGQMWDLIPPPGVPRRIPKTLTPDQLLAVVTKGCISARDLALVLVVLDSGIRLGEVASIDKRDIAPDVMRVWGKTGTREVPITQESRNLLMEVGDENYPWVHRLTGDPLSLKGIQKAYRRIFYRAGVKGARTDLGTLLPQNF